MYTLYYCNTLHTDIIDLQVAIKKYKTVIMNPSCRTDFGTLSIIFKHNRAEQALKFGALLNMSATSVCTRGPSELFLIIIGLDLCSLRRRNIIYKSHEYAEKY